MEKQDSREKELLEQIKNCLRCNNGLQAILLIERYGQEQKDFVFINRFNEEYHALYELVSLKKWKDEFGKDEWYLEKQPLAWINAEKIIEQRNKNEIELQLKKK